MQLDVLLRDVVTRLEQALSDRLLSVVLHGPLVHGDRYRAAGQPHLLVVIADLELATLQRLADPIGWWLARGQPWPRLFSPALIRDSLDVFPIELFDISRHHRILYGADPFADLVVDRAALRLQCERELREQLMRLREGYIESAGKARPLAALLAIAYPSFARVFRGVLALLGAPVAVHDRDVVTALCARLALDRAQFDDAERIATGEIGDLDVVAGFGRYLHELQQVVARIDRLDLVLDGSTP